MASSWWYCLSHGVEEGVGCRSGDRLGPYSSREEAEQALEKARARTEAEDARDRAYDDRGRSPDR